MPLKTISLGQHNEYKRKENKLKKLKKERVNRIIN